MERNQGKGPLTVKRGRVVLNESGKTGKIRSVSSHPEGEVLICCARVEMDPEIAERLRALLQQDLNWERLIRIAYRNEVAPLLYWNLKRQAPEAVPEAALDGLQRFFHHNARYNLLMTRELLRILNLLEAREVRAISFKGPLLASLIYGDLSLRQFSDLDILIHKHDVSRTKALLMSLGYRPRKSLAAVQEAPHMKSEPVEVFVRDDGIVSVDLHWGLGRTSLPFQLDQDSFWERREAVSLGGTTVCSLPPEELLLVLCTHGARHLWNRMKWICDIAELLRVRRGMDWERVIKLASDLGIERMLFLGLLLATDLLGAAIPEEVLHRAQASQGARALADQVRASLFLEADQSSGVVNQFMFRTRAREHLRDKVAVVRYLIRRTATPTTTDRALIRLPAPLSFLYYLIRPIRLIGAYGTGPFRRNTRFGKSP
jgi:hypothetical protein